MLLLTCLFALFGTALACAPSGPQGTTYECPARKNTARAYLAPTFRTTAAIPPGAPFTVAGAEECANGQCGENKVYYNEMVDPESLAFAGATNAQQCPDLCACADDGTCYTWKPTNTDDQVAFALVTWCDGSSFSGCALYAFIVPSTFTDGVVATDGSGAEITLGSLIDPTTGFAYDIRKTRDPYTQIVSATCDGCAGECAQKHPTDY